VSELKRRGGCYFSAFRRCSRDAFPPPDAIIGNRVNAIARLDAADETNPIGRNVRIRRQGA